MPGKQICVVMREPTNVHPIIIKSNYTVSIVFSMQSVHRACDWSVKSWNDFVQSDSSTPRPSPPTPSDAYMRHWSGSTLVQVMACRLLGAKPLPEPMLAYCLLSSLGTNFNEILIEIQPFSFKKMRLKMSSAKWPFILSRGGGGMSWVRHCPLLVCCAVFDVWYYTTCDKVMIADWGSQFDKDIISAQVAKKRVTGRLLTNCILKVPPPSIKWMHVDVGLILALRSANERRRFFVTTSLFGWMQA